MVNQSAVAESEEDLVKDISLSYDGNKLASATKQGQISVWSQ